MDSPWYLGPQGDLRALPSPDGGVQESIRRYGGVHQGLSGARTVDVTGTRGSWTFNFKSLDFSEYNRLMALYTRMYPGTLRLIDPRRKNRLSRQSCAGLVIPYSSDLGLRVQNADYVMTVDYPSGLPEKGRAVELLNAPAPAQPVVLRWDGWPNLTTVFPLETVIGSCYMRTSTGTRTASFRIDHYDYVGNQLGSIMQDITITSSWTRFLVTGTMPAGAMTCQMALVHTWTSGTAIRLAAPQLETGSVATAWELGGGAPTVHMDSLEASAPNFRINNVTMTLLEA